jgi:uncharacterized protein
LNLCPEKSRLATVNLNQALSEAELDELADFLESDSVPKETMDLSMLDDYLTAIAIGPETILPSQWLPRVWGDVEQPTFDSLEQAQKILNLILRYYNQTGTTFMDAPERFHPFLYEYEENGERTLSAEEWCVGFTLGIHLRTEAWAPLFEDEEAAQILTPIVAFSLEEAWQEAAEGHDAAEVQALLIAMLPTAVQAIHAYSLPFRQKCAAGLVNEHFPLGGDAKTGRNTRCPCGSGKKYEKCCGAPRREA